MVPEATVTDGKVQSAVVFLAPILLYRAEGGSPSTPNYNGCVPLYDLLVEALRSTDYRKATSFVGHMHTELGKVHCRGPAL